MATLPLNRQTKQAFPKINSANHEITSPVDRAYNCIAWAAEDKHQKWWPDPFGYYWPPELPDENTIDNFVNAFQLLGYELTEVKAFDPKYDRIAIYAKNGSPKHASRQIDERFWTSKLGESFDICHEFDALDGPEYGSVEKIMQRPIQ